ncbi:MULTISPECIES: PepSY domain-containing protein [unclassified Azospirillum]|uniref:PepSY domain-containing protein n=1 Tax=unclassified Azospirillum TaxID=2630922 RepID=UPI000B63BABA|nr:MULTISPECIES: PepSY domain-containing protein [unclassified Azospirillum]SNS37716.1 Peptidase propeptide and YPEB domain-containing protein [Azospirillum sp. RU38E]SNS56285.1 Peptidase propeptide and YPEB domain-containing protein [Azospirillum sp. RU37A]
MKTRNLKIAALTLATGLIALPLGGFALAQNATPATPAATPALPQGQPMGMTQVIDHLSAKGYTEIREVERKSDKLFEVKARDSQGIRRELLVDARSGEILKDERD